MLGPVCWKLSVVFDLYHSNQGMAVFLQGLGDIFPEALRYAACFPVLSHRKGAVSLFIYMFIYGLCKKTDVSEEYLYQLRVYGLSK